MSNYFYYSGVLKIEDFTFVKKFSTLLRILSGTESCYSFETVKELVVPVLSFSSKSVAKRVKSGIRSFFFCFEAPEVEDEAANSY